MAKFKLVSDYEPAGDQPRAIEGLVGGIKKGLKQQTLLGVTGSGKTFTMANIVSQIQRPTLVMAPNKTLAAQLAAEFREFFPDNAVHYFVSYYDYYQPEAYVPQTDTYIAKDSSINEEIDKLRQAATQSLLTRDDVLIVASVSCIYGIGRAEDYAMQTVKLAKGKSFNRTDLLRNLVNIQYNRNDVNLIRSNFRVRGEIVEIFPSYSDFVIRLDFFGDELEKIREVDYLTGEVLTEMDSVEIFPAKHYVVPLERVLGVLPTIEKDLDERAKELKGQGKNLEAERLLQRTRYDLEMLREIGYVSGIENYSRYFDGRKPGEPAATLLDYFPKDFLLFIDESHMTIPQIGGMYAGDRSRKTTLVEHGFRLPSALDNRPLQFDEFLARTNQTVYVSATPSSWETDRSDQIVEQIIRPTGLVDPEIEVRPTEHQIDDLLAEVQATVKTGGRVLVTTLTKRMSEDLAEYLADINIKVHYLHSDVETLDRIEILRDLRLGKVDVLVGINLLREGIDLPEVSLVAILDADKEGFLRSQTSLIQTFGRAARNLEGRVIMYADRITNSMQRAMEETARRRAIQVAYNEAHGITPETIKSKIRPSMKKEVIEMEAESPRDIKKFAKQANKEEKLALIKDWEAAMHLAAENLEFERAARLRDQINVLEEDL
jgi:excinuclease ABC subunit B